MRVSIANLSEAQSNERIDSQFFKPEYVSSSNILNSSEYSILSDISHITDGNHLKIAEDFDNKSGVRYLRGQNLNSDMILHDRNIVYISEQFFNNLGRSHIFKNDIIITIVGANTGLVGLVFNPPEKLVANCKLGIVRPDNSEISSGFLYAFLIGRFGQHQILRSIRGGGQTGLILPDMRQLKITRLSNGFEKDIDRLVSKGHRGYEISKEIYQQAQDILLAELGLNDWQPEHRLTFIKNYSDTKQAERIDAEYFQPKYDDIVNAIKGYKGGWDKLGNLVKIKKSIEVGSAEYLDEGIPFVRVSNISPFEITEEKYISERLYSELTSSEPNMAFSKTRNHQPQQGEILFSKDGSPGIAYYLKDKPQKMIVSGGILRLKINTDRVSNDYLTLVLNSILVQEQVNRDVGGSIILHWRPEQVRESIIPILSEDKQQEIQQKVTKSIELRNQSRRLLENAKRAVEMAIEEDENKAIQWLNAQT